jgi:hypothetical protein
MAAWPPRRNRRWQIARIVSGLAVPPQGDAHYNAPARGCA